MLSISTDSLDRKVLKDEYGSSLMFEQSGDLTLIYPDDDNQVDRDALEATEWALNTNTVELIELLKELTSRLEEDLY